MNECNNIISVKNLITYLPLDVKLRRLLIWYEQHKSEVLPKHQHYLSCQFRLFDSMNQLKLIDSTAMKHSEKNALLHGLVRAKMTWRNYKKLKENRQQPITKFFKPKKQHDRDCKWIDRYEDEDKDEVKLKKH